MDGSRSTREQGVVGEIGMRAGHLQHLQHFQEGDRPGLLWQKPATDWDCESLRHYKKIGRITENVDWHWFYIFKTINYWCQ